MPARKKRKGATSGMQTAISSKQQESPIEPNNKVDDDQEEDISIDHSDSNQTNYNTGTTGRYASLKADDIC